jgi:hypothetical protein
MGEVATTLAAFQQQLDKRLASIHSACEDDGHDLIQHQYLAQVKLDEVVAHYVPKLPQVVLVPLLLRLAQRLSGKHLNTAANKICYSRIFEMDLLNQPHKETAYSLLDRTGAHVQACLGAAYSISQIQLMQDQHLRMTSTVTELSKCLLVWPVYWFPG